MQKTVTVVFASIFYSTTSFATHLIILNGSSCSGKSSTAKELIETLRRTSEPFWDLESLDQYIIELNSKSSFSEHHPPYFKCISANAQFYDPFHRRIEQKLNRGVNVILDHCFMHDSAFTNALFHFRDQAVMLVKVYTDFAIATERLRQRNQGTDQTQRRRPEFLSAHYGEQWMTDDELHRFPLSPSIPGCAMTCRKRGYPTHANKIYDLQIDTSEKSPQYIAQAIADIYNREKDHIQKGTFYTRHISTWETGHAGLEYSSSSGFWQLRESMPFSKEYGSFSPDSLVETAHQEHSPPTF